MVRFVEVLILPKHHIMNAILYTSSWTLIEVAYERRDYFSWFLFDFRKLWILWRRGWWLFALIPWDNGWCFLHTERNTLQWENENLCQLLLYHIRLLVRETTVRSNNWKAIFKRNRYLSASCLIILSWFFINSWHCRFRVAFVSATTNQLVHYNEKNKFRTGE